MHADGRRSGARGHPAVFGFYANKQLTTGEGGMVTLGDAALKERIDSERNQGRARTWAGSTTIAWASTTAFRISLARSGLRSCGAWTSRWPRAPRVAERYREALAAIEGLQLPCADAGGDVRGWFVFVVQLPRGVDRDETVRALARVGVQSKPYLPAIHLMSFYRERFGHRAGEFPVCEDVAARSLALPFFPQMSEGQVARVCEALRAALGR